ncbi:uncharacterized protein LOC130757937 [Actinidia eriantha]|uniref:uncharacterized protein LOC130757937 n=1 Tax=Actinidia eriantha TaxID=165200 RepID=UPI0025839C73|nr:uncharacterized protein LOC130757937 [Actinidia eriantha]
MARDVRKFVQSFNMSRQFADQQPIDETLAPLPEDANNQRNKRTDWSEYIDLEDNHQSQFKDEQDDEFEPRIVTELPKAVFKRPKLDAYSSDLGEEGGGKGFKPVFSKRNLNKEKEPKKSQSITVNDAFKLSEENISANKEPQKCLSSMNRGDPKLRRSISTTAEGSSKWSDDTIQDKKIHPWRCQPTTMKGASKWDSYITEEDDDFQPKIRREFADHTNQWEDGVVGATLYGEIVEEDIHPDFQ